MNKLAQKSWRQQNQIFLDMAIADMRALLQQLYDQSNGKIKHELAINALDYRQAQFDDMNPLPALETLCQLFGLSSFEHSILLLCAGWEMDAEFANLVTALQGGNHRGGPTSSLTLSLFTDAHRSALAPTAPLRRWRMIEMGQGNGLTQTPLQIDERILHYLSGILYLDTRLQGMVRPVQEIPELLPSQARVAENMTLLWIDATEKVARPVIQLTGSQTIGKHTIAVNACARMGWQLHSLQSEDIPENYNEREALSRLWEREAALCDSALIINCEKPESLSNVSAFIENTHAMLIVNVDEPICLKNRTSINLEPTKPSTCEQISLWQQALGSEAKKHNGQLNELAWQFQMDRQSINGVVSQLQQTDSNESSDEWRVRLWDSCRIQARRPLNALAQRIEPRAEWNDLVLPPFQLDQVKEIAVHIRQRGKVYDTWGFADKIPRGLGISALFTGSSGTGKTMAAEVLANELRLDLYRIDLSQVVNKYIGETEKNLRKVFDAAEQSGAILLFDEADALFGKRSDVKDSHDRYSNIECCYLLQRMEAYCGCSILTTNMEQALDQAFVRRIRFILRFPYPGMDLREQIWRRIFPDQTPTDYLDFKQLSKLAVAGGNIRNIAMNAAFIAAEVGNLVTMQHIEQATRGEYMKLDKQLRGTELAVFRQELTNRRQLSAIS